MVTVGSAATDWANDGLFGDGWHLFGIGSKQYEEAAKKYGMTKSNICVIIKKEKITKVKVGVQNLIVKEELEKVMAERLAQFGSYRVQ